MQCRRGPSCGIIMSKRKPSRVSVRCIKHMKIALLGFLFATLLVSVASAQTDDVNIIPKPRLAARADGAFRVDQNTKIVATDKPGKRNAEALRALLERQYGL